MQKEEAENRKAWKMSVRARGRKFHLKFNASNIDPSWNFLRFSFFLRLHHLFLEIKSEFDAPISCDKKPATSKSKFLSFLRKFKSRKRSTIPSTKSSYPQPQNKVDIVEPMCGGSVMIGSAASLSHSLHEKGIVLYGGATVLVLFLILLRNKNKYLGGKENLMWVGVVLEIVGLCLVKYLECDEVWLSEIVWKAWNYCVSSGCLYVLSQVTFSRFCHSAGVDLG